MRANLLLLFCSVIISFFLLEFTLRMVAPPTLTPASFLHSPNAELYGWAPAPSARTRFYNPETDVSLWYRTNSHGWKDVEHAFEKSRGSVRILIVGDSHTYGIVQLEDVYTRRLENILKEEGFNTVEVLGVGAGGWGTDQELEFLKNEGLKYSPDIVICQFTVNDILDNLNPNEETPPEAIYWHKPFHYNLADGNLIRTELKPLKPSIKDKLVRFASETAIVFNLRRMMKGVKAALTNKKLVNSFRQKKKRRGNDWGAAMDPLVWALYSEEENELIGNGWALYSALIYEMKRQIEASGAKFAIFSETGDEAKREFYLTNGIMSTDQDGDYFLFNGQWKSIDYLTPHKKMTDICCDNGVLLIETKRKYQRYDSDPHANPAGNRAMARDIADFLKEWEYFQELTTR